MRQKQQQKILDLQNVLMTAKRNSWEKRRRTWRQEKGAKSMHELKLVIVIQVMKLIANHINVGSNHLPHHTKFSLDQHLNQMYFTSSWGSSASSKYLLFGIIISNIVNLNKKSKSDKIKSKTFKGARILKALFLTVSQNIPLIYYDNIYNNNLLLYITMMNQICTRYTIENIFKGVQMLIKEIH